MQDVAARRDFKIVCGGNFPFKVAAIKDLSHLKYVPCVSTSLIMPLLTTPSKGMNNALSAGMQSSIVHTLRRHGKQRRYK